MYFDTLAGRRLEVGGTDRGHCRGGRATWHRDAARICALLALLRAISDGAAAGSTFAFTPGSLT